MLSVVKLGARIYLVSDVPGVIMDRRTVGALEASQVRALLDHGVALDGTTVKLRQAGAV